MLQVVIPRLEIYDEVKNEFSWLDSVKFSIEHSLVSLSKWEAKWRIPFLMNSQKTREQSLDYIRCMTITQNINPEVYERIPPDVMEGIVNYIEEPMTATWFGGAQKRGNNKDVITAEVIYHMMIVHNIPLECQKWHLNKLFTLIQVCNIKNSPPEKRNSREIMAERRAMNELRKKELGTSG